MASLSTDGYNQQTNDAYRAIGRYMVAFSVLVHELRAAVAQHISPGKAPLANIALGEFSAMPICHAFFGLARLAAGFTRDEAKVADLLAIDVEKAIRTRNDVAHGDWRVGWLGHGASGVQILDPQLVRIVPHEKRGPFKTKDLTVADIDEMTDRLECLTTLAIDFGNIALGLPIYRADGSLSTDEYRVADVFVVRGKGQNAAIVREGPRAGEVVPVPYSP
jgi:hypothetical protein